MAASRLENLITVTVFSVPWARRFIFHHHRIFYTSLIRHKKIIKVVKNFFVPSLVKYITYSLMFLGVVSNKTFINEFLWVFIVWIQLIAFWTVKGGRTGRVWVDWKLIKNCLNSHISPIIHFHSYRLKTVRDKNRNFHATLLTDLNSLFLCNNIPFIIYQFNVFSIWHMNRHLFLVSACVLELPEKNFFPFLLKYVDIRKANTTHIHTQNVY